MKITKENKKRNKKILAIVCTVGIVLLIAATVYLVFFKGSLLGWQPFGSSVPVTNPATQDSSDTNHGTKDDTTTGTDKTTDQIPVSETLTASIDTLDQSNGVITFAGSANDTKEGGSCSIVFSNPNDRPITRTVAASISNGMAICGPINIPETEFSFLGEWTATFRYYINDTQAMAERKMIIE